MTEPAYRCWCCGEPMPCGCRMGSGVVQPTTKERALAILAEERSAESTGRGLEALRRAYERLEREL